VAKKSNFLCAEWQKVVCSFVERKGYVLFFICSSGCYAYDGTAALLDRQSSGQAERTPIEQRLSIAQITFVYSANVLFTQFKMRPTRRKPNMNDRFAVFVIVVVVDEQNVGHIIGIHHFGTVEKALARVQETIGARPANYRSHPVGTWQAHCLIDGKRYQFAVSTQRAVDSEVLSQNAVNRPQLVGRICFTKHNRSDLLTPFVVARQ